MARRKEGRIAAVTGVITIWEGRGRVLLNG